MPLHRDFIRLLILAREKRQWERQWVMIVVCFGFRRYAKAAGIDPLGYETPAFLHEIMDKLLCVKLLRAIELE